MTRVMSAYPDVCSGMMQRAVNSYTPVMKQCVVTSCIVQWDKMGVEWLRVGFKGTGTFWNVKHIYNNCNVMPNRQTTNQYYKFICV